MYNLLLRIVGSGENYVLSFRHLNYDADLQLFSSKSGGIVSSSSQDPYVNWTVELVAESQVSHNHGMRLQTTNYYKKDEQAMYVLMK